MSDEEWEFVAPDLTLLREDAAQRVRARRDGFDALRWMVKAACPWRLLLPGDFPPWQAGEQQGKRWMAAACLRHAARDPRPSAAIYDGRTLQSRPESGGRAGDDGDKRKKASQVHVAVDTLGHRLALVLTPANEQERAQVAALSEQVQAATRNHVEPRGTGPGRCGLHGASTRRPGGGTRDQAGGRQTGRGQTWLRALAPPLGGGAIFCLARQISSALA